MKNTLLWIILAWSVVAQAAPLDSSAPSLQKLTPTPQQSVAAHLAAEVLTRYHYKALPLDQAMSVKIFDHYLKLLDPDKLIFLQADIDQLAGLRTTLGDAILKEDLSIPFAIYNLYALRASERYVFARSLLKDGFDFRKNESYQVTRNDKAWAQSEQEAHDLWRKRIKNDWLRLKLAGKNDQDIAETLDKRYANTLKRIAREKREDAFQAFMNAYTMAIEPHTNYMGPSSAEDFDIAMKLSLIGIGAVLTQQDDYTVIRELVAGGPAALSGQLNTGDRIVGVAQGAEGVMTDIIGWHPDDAVKLIRGQVGTLVVLDVIPAGASLDAKHKRISLVRQKVSLDDQAAKKSVITIADGGNAHRIGIISLPGFYEDFGARQSGDPNFRSATRDVAKLLDEFKSEKIDSVLIDLRNNGGGSLGEAVRLVGLFVGNGPVVQERDALGHLRVDGQTNASVKWEGPLGVLINRGSASASEIFAAAIQDYGRGLVIGEPSFGKGTVQTMVNLDEMAKNDKPKFGELKMTIAQFFRINGGTTQLRGVTPDILLPMVSDPEHSGEASFDNALPWVQINAADYLPVGNVKSVLPVLLERHEARMTNDRKLQCIQEAITRLRIQHKANLVSLNEADRRSEQISEENRAASCEPVASAADVSPILDGKQKVAVERSSAFRDDGLQSDERNLKDELALEKSFKDRPDVLLNEAAHILSDEIGLNKSNDRLANHIRPGSKLSSDTEM